MLYPTELRAHLNIRHLRGHFLRFRKSHPEISPRILEKTGFPFLLMTRASQTVKKQSAWERTRYQRLFRFVSSGTIFARFKIAGKQVRKNLKTSNLERAKSKLAEFERDERAIAEDRRRGKKMFGEALDEYLQTRKRDATLKPERRHTTSNRLLHF